MDTTTIEVTAGDGSTVVARDVRHARVAALALARRTGRAEVHRVGVPEVDATPRFLVGTAWATPMTGDDGQGCPSVFVRWRAARTA